MKILPFSAWLHLFLIRQKIDNIDDSIYELLEHRFQMARLTRHYKSDTFDMRREHEILERLMSKGRLPPECVHDVWTTIMTHSKKEQNKILSN